MASKSVHKLPKDRGTINKICSIIAIYVYRIESCYNEIRVPNIEGKRAYRSPIHLFGQMDSAVPPTRQACTCDWTYLFVSAFLQSIDYAA